MRENEDEQNSSARDGSADPFGKFPRRMDPRFPGMVFLGSVDGPGFILNKLRVRFAEKAKEVVDYLVGRFGGEPSCAEPVRNYSHWLTNKASAARLLSIGRNTVYRLIETGRLDTVELNGCSRVTMRSINAFLDGERPANAATEDLVRASQARYAATFQGKVA